MDERCSIKAGMISRRPPRMYVVDEPMLQKAAKEIHGLSYRKTNKYKKICRTN